MADASTPLLTVPPSYLYMEYADDADLQSMRDAYNQYAQQYLDWFNQVCLGDYRSTLVSGSFLDWIAEGIYGQKRVPLPLSNVTETGGYATLPYATIPFAGMEPGGNAGAVMMNDDIFKRVMTWNLYEGDGFQFTTTWLKRRIMRFLSGQNGNDGPFTNTYLVGVEWSKRFTADVTVTIPSSWESTANYLVLCISNGIVNLPLGYTVNITTDTTS